MVEPMYREGANGVAFGGNSHSYWSDGYLHREEGPAYVGSDLAIWAQHGIPHRNMSDGPAIITLDPTTGDHLRYTYYTRGVLVFDSPAAAVRDNLEWYAAKIARPDTNVDMWTEGTDWYVNAAMEEPEITLAFKNRRLHRTDGPAVIRHDNNTCEFWWEGECHEKCTEEERPVVQLRWLASQLGGARRDEARTAENMTDDFTRNACASQYRSRKA